MPLVAQHILERNDQTEQLTHLFRVTPKAFIQAACLIQGLFGVHLYKYVEITRGLNLRQVSFHQSGTAQGSAPDGVLHFGKCTKFGHWIPLLVMRKAKELVSAGRLAYAKKMLHLRTKTRNMFHQSISAFGQYPRHTLRSGDGRHSLSLVPGHGACLLELRLHGVSLLDAYQSPASMESNDWGKNIVLFPFPNRLKAGRYSWLGREYQFPINDKGTGNALHGFGWNMPMAVERLELSEHEGSITCIHHHDGALAWYPFPFSFSITFSLSGNGDFSMTMRFQNTGSDILPAGVGWHPYFRLGTSLSEVYLQLPGCRMVGIDEHMIPNGDLLPDARFSNLKPIGDTVLDNCFLLDSGQDTAILEGPAGRLTYRQENGQGKFPFLQVFTPPHRNAIALEPMSCNIDAYNNGMGLWTLAPGAIGTASIQLSLEPGSVS